MTTDTTVADPTTATPPVAGDTTVAPTTAAPAAGDPAAPTTQEATPPDTPVEYTYTLPDGMELDAKGAEALTAIAKEHKLPPAAAQKIADIYAERQQAQAQAWADTVTTWETEVMKDPAIGGDKWPESRAVAKQALETYGTPELKALLDSSRMGSHPEVVRFFHKVGLTLKQDSIVTGTPKPAARSFYDKSNMA